MKNFALYILLLSSFAFPQAQFTSFINHIYSLPDSSKSAAVDSFMSYARTAGIPFIEDNFANFIRTRKMILIR